MKALKIKGLGHILQVALLCLGLGACATPGFKAEVTRTHTLGTPAGERILIEPADGKEAGLEFQNYAAQLAQYFADYGYLPAESANPRYLVTFDFYANPDPSFRPPGGLSLGFGVGASSNHVGVGAGTTVDFHDEDDLYYLHIVSIRIVDAATGREVFTGTSSGHARGEYWPSMMPRLLGALFINWPGESGTTQTVELPEK